ncbi:hypothetical protein MFIFM68171_02950 [Madurella fahalii]|uniref:Uncharacterized protein n=1 Tax=Madurella fahalii TaxID=1157608 RepID=A0ABQ0G4N7_9PEZI
MALSVVSKLVLLGVFALFVTSSPTASPELSRQLRGFSVVHGRQDKASPSPPLAIDHLRSQMSNPAEILSVLLIIGGDVIQKAIAQQSGTRFWITPVAFSFGWVAYTFNAVMSVFGDGILMPRPEDELCVVNLESGTRKRNESWVLWRLVRDLEITSVSEKKSTVRIFWIDANAGQPTLDWLSWLFVVCLPVQLVLAAIPWWMHGNWIIFFMTCAGSVLATVTGSLPQWKKEKYDARKNKPGMSYILTRGNGHPHSFGIMSRPSSKYPEPAGFRLEDLAVVRPDRVESRATKIAMPILAVLWVALLIAVSGLQRDTWYLFAVGAVGMVQNITVAGMPRTPSAHGIPLTESGQWKMEGNKTMDLLQEAERRFPGLGLRMLDIYFENTKLKPHEKEFWNRAKGSLKDRKERWQVRRETVKGDNLGALIDTMSDLPVPVIALAPSSTTSGTIGRRSAATVGDGAITPGDGHSLANGSQ